MKTIIIYATRYGSVEKAAMKLKSHLEGEVDIANVKSAPALCNYDMIILGGSIYDGTVQQELSKLSEDNLHDLLKKKTGLFICARIEKEGATESYFSKSFPQQLYDAAIAKVNLGHEIDLNILSDKDLETVRKGGIEESISVFHEDRIKEFAEVMNRSV